MSTETTSNEVRERVVEDASAGRSLARTSVQRELRTLCKDDDEKKYLLVYLSRTKLVHLQDIVADIKNVDGCLAIHLRKEENIRWKQSQNVAVTPFPVFSTS